VEQEIFIYGEIGKQITLDTVLSKITPKASRYVVHINSPGGDVFEGFAIYNALKNTGKEIEVRIVGQCASIATSIASVASPGKLFMNERGSFMIHNPRFMSISGEAKDLRNAAVLLDQIKSQFLKDWNSRTGLSEQQLSQMYDSETYLSPEQAKEMGFVDEVKPEMKAVAYADIKKYYKMENKNKVLGMFDDLKKRILAVFEAPKSMTDTLADGRVIVVESEDGDWTGKSIRYEDGSEVPPGTYELNGGRTLTVGEGSVIETVTEVENKTEEDLNAEEDMKLKEENETLKARIAELESALNARNDAYTKVEAKKNDLENKLNTKVKALSDELEKLKITTVGDTTPPAKAVNQPVGNGTQVEDPMKQLFGKIIIDPRK
jgi:ATP-dependent protease ClpP protease subunit